VDCADVLLKLSSQSGPEEGGNSGVDTPLFHALDSFLGRVKGWPGTLHAYEQKRRKALPLSVQSFLVLLEDPDLSICKYIENSLSSPLKLAFDMVLHLYAWLLERHCMKSIGVIGLAFASGQSSSNGGTIGTPTAGSPADEILNEQMLAAIDSRVGKRSRLIMGLVIKVIETEWGKSFTLKLPLPVPILTGDHVQAWPENRPEHVLGVLNRYAAEGVECKYLKGKLAHRDLRPLRNVAESTTSESFKDLVHQLPRLEPQFYSIGRVDSDLALKIRLAV
jgi:hypothetical protein